MKYLVTGGAGFIGTNLCERLIKDGNEVVVIDNLSVSNCNVAFLESLGIRVYVNDISDYSVIENLFQDIDYVVHLAAMNRAQRSIADPLGANDTNVTGTLNCLEAARKHNVKRFINISSSSVYASQRDVLLKEDMALEPPHPYGIGKLCGEHYARIYYNIFGLNTVTLRFFSVYGPRQLGTIDKAGVVAKFIHLANSGQPLEIYGDGEQMRNFSFVNDVVECVVRALDARSVVGEIINIASPQEVSVNELAKLVEKVVGRQLVIKHVEKLLGDPSRNPADVEKCMRLLGYVPTSSFEEGIQHTYNWYLSKT
jgi:nucleoside-diphosphate-sugar epimerase